MNTTEREQWYGNSIVSSYKNGEYMRGYAMELTSAFAANGTISRAVEAATIEGINAVDAEREAAANQPPIEWPEEPPVDVPEETPVE